ncbi:hypothetical protein C0993_008666 [Termitomyces sp. T159_Od127]|nr:hypothetical protein C0993_008666 [Termitomyces sp. T159_Od127]
MVAAREGGLHPGEVEEGQSKEEEESSGSEEEEESAPASLTQVGPLHRKQQPSAVAWGKRWASPSLEVGPSKRPRGDVAMASSLGLHFFSPTSAHPQPPPQESMEQSLLASTVELRRCLQEGYAQSEKERSELAAVTMDQDWARRDRDVALVAVREWDAELTVLRVQVAELESRVARETPGEGQAMGAVQVAEQKAICWQDWALLEAASSREGFCISGWAWEHRLLLDGASAAHTLLWEGVGQMPFNLPAELDIGLAQLDILLAGHQRRNAIAPGSWLNMAINMGEGLPVWEEHLASLVTQMETAMLVTGPAAGSREGGDQEGD